MSSTNISAESDPINKDLLAILCCPDSKQSVFLIDTSSLSKLNQVIDSGELKNQGGNLVKEKLQGGLIRSDEKVVYPIRENIPILLIEEGIPVEGIL